MVLKDLSRIKPGLIAVQEVQEHVQLAELQQFGQPFLLLRLQRALTAASSMSGLCSTSYGG
ncbi:hypothetical protein EHV15_26040 [Paenibacillus oralis]|uniref:Uncharacterized protein n=1 Tax=Paenibacillus oralis TaxID=2490856 RepID=A0A3P3U6J5_9BACL|nr:hypothetical protein [Paenibacillus oralis]RRJ65992.1 hypothetical protein EHV15_26040 [Paenibacillus oralis]